MEQLLNKVRIVLVETSHPGNIGASARAMKTMGLSDLVLVNPAKFPHLNATEMAAGADDILDQAKVVPTLADALVDCHVIVGTSARPRNIPTPLLNARECGQKAMTVATTSRIAIVFGREYAGLTNEELWQCHYHVNIATNPEYASLNLAATVQIIAYEIRLAAGITHVPLLDYDELATHEESEYLFEHLEKVLYELEFMTAENPKRVMPRLRRLFLRNQLEKMEVKILRGILTKISEKLG